MSRCLTSLDKTTNYWLKKWQLAVGPEDSQRSATQMSSNIPQFQLKAQVQ
jgi:hypothetical protein